MEDFEADIRRIGTRLGERAAGRKPRLYRGLTGALPESSMADAQLRDALLQLVAVLPACFMVRPPWLEVGAAVTMVGRYPWSVYR